MRISDWSSDVCSSDLIGDAVALRIEAEAQRVRGGDVDGADSDAPVPGAQVPEDAVPGSTSSDDAPSEEVSPEKVPLEEVPLEEPSHAALTPDDTIHKPTPATNNDPRPLPSTPPPTTGAGDTSFTTSPHT